MSKKPIKSIIFILLFVTFIDFMGIGLIYPIFSKLLFDTQLKFLPSQTSNEIRGLWLGFLFALMPLIQFFTLPIWGTISDRKGRKKPLLISLSITIIAHLTSVFGIYFSSIILLLTSRLFLGISAGNISIIQASMADISTAENKAKNFGLYSMAIGIGFTFGPFLGGILFTHDNSFPFWFSLIITALNFILAIFMFKETIRNFIEKKISFTVGLKNLKNAFKYENIRIVFLCYFLIGFAWTFFMDFIPVYLIDRFNFTTGKIGLFYGGIGGFYALCAGLLIRPFLSKFKLEKLFFMSCLFGGLCILSIPFYSITSWLGLFVILFSFFSSFQQPTATTLVSNNTSPDAQGETLGILGAIYTASYAISALLAGFFIGLKPTLTIWISGSIYLLSAFIFMTIFRRNSFLRVK